MIDLLLLNACLIAGLMLVVWLISLPLKDVSIIDIVWGFGFVLVAWATYFTGPETGQSLLIPLLVTAWGLRLSAYLAWRKIGEPEDFRYREMRDGNPNSFPIRSLLTIFALQGLLMWIIALPLQTVHPTGTAPLLLTLCGALIWVAGFVFESLGDWQLARFKADPANAGRVMDRGLWYYTRHPNYFGDFLIWWGFYVLALAQGSPWWTIVGPIVMSILLMRVSGVTLLERSLKIRKEGYAGYVARTSAFFPWWPRNASR